MDSIVLDASVCLKWFLLDEADRERALLIRDRIVNERLRPIAPSHLPLEIARGLVRAVRRGRQVAPAVSAAIDSFMQMEFELSDIVHITGDAARLALSLGVSVQDAAYLIVASQAEVPFLTADEKLHVIASAGGHDVILLSELPTA